MSNDGREATHQAIRKSLKESGLDYIDLYLIHGPLGGPQARRESWEEVVKARDEGILRHIGVSNFGLRHLEEMKTAWGTASNTERLEWAGQKPSVNQVDVHRMYLRIFVDGQYIL
jgi:diketogulonate reductase-like aldo/keto reductase